MSALFEATRLFTMLAAVTYIGMLFIVSAFGPTTFVEVATYALIYDAITIECYARLTPVRREQ